MRTLKFLSFWVFFLLLAFSDSGKESKSLIEELELFYSEIKKRQTNQKMIGRKSEPEDLVKRP